MSQRDPRMRLAAEQAELVRALTGHGPTPAGFYTIRILVAAAWLARKRLRAVTRAWPALADALGKSMASYFAAYAAAQSLPQHGGPLADGWAFARTLARQGQLPEAARLELLAVELHYAAGANELVPRRGLVVRSALLRRPYRWLVAVRMPWLGEFWLTLPLRRLTRAHGQKCQCRLESGRSSVNGVEQGDRQRSKEQDRHPSR
jgi:hypothetical protein